MKTISILGCGWLGLPFGKFLINKSYRVKGSTTSEAKLSLIENLKIVPYQLVLSAKGVYDESFFDSDLLFVNIPPGRKDPEALLNYPAKIKSILPYVSKSCKLIFASSTGVYSNNNNIVDEKSETAPSRKSAQAVLAAEQIIKESTKDFIILRFGGLVGGDRKAGAFLAGRKNVSNGNVRINMVHLDDCIQVLYEVINSKQSNEVFNVVADAHPSRREFYSIRAKLEGMEVPQFNEEIGTYKIVSNAKLKTALGYKFIHPEPLKFPV